MDRPKRQRLVGDSGRHEPRHPAAIIEAELQPALVALNRDTFVSDERNETTVALHAYRATADLDELDLDDEQVAETA